MSHNRKGDDRDQMSSREKSAANHWRDRVESHHAQSEAVQDASALEDDFWRPAALLEQLVADGKGFVDMS